MDGAVEFSTFEGRGASPFAREAGHKGRVDLAEGG